MRLKKVVHILVSICFLVLASGCGDGVEERVNLEFLWETDGFDFPESVLRVAGGYIYVSNAAGDKWTTGRTTGFISRLAEGGRVDVQSWASGLQAPKGMAAYGSSLFVADIDRLVEIDLDLGVTINTYYPSDGLSSYQLNDVAVDPNNGDVYVSNTANGSIYRLRSGLLDLWLQDTSLLSEADGLYLKNGVLRIGVYGAVRSVSPSDVDAGRGAIETAFTVTLSGRTTRAVDGLVSLGGSDGYLTSWFEGRVIHLPENSDLEQVLDLTDKGFNCSDIYYHQSDATLYVPTYNAHTVRAYRVEYVEEEDE